jgi:hypothetical protein
MKQFNGTSVGRLDDVCMSDFDRERAKAYLRGIERVVDIIWRPFGGGCRVKSTCTRRV